MSTTNMKCVAIIGSTGLLGQALVKEANSRGINLIGIARRGAHHSVDASDSSLLRRTLDVIKPSAIINAAALVSIENCEKNSEAAYLINAGLVGTLADYSRTNRIKFCHISTDHYFTGDGSRLHNEQSPVTLVNEYARSKYAGECIALTVRESLVLRTNIVGFRRWPGQHTFVEWLISELTAGGKITLFDDFFTSSISARSLATVIFDLLTINASGLLNVSSSECCSKLQFALCLAQRLRLVPSEYIVGSVKSLPGTPRAESLGLDVSRAESLLGYGLPTTMATIESLAQEFGA